MGSCPSRACCTVIGHRDLPHINIIVLPEGHYILKLHEMCISHNATTRVKDLKEVIVELMKHYNIINPAKVRFK